MDMALWRMKADTRLLWAIVPYDHPPAFQLRDMDCAGICVQRIKLKANFVSRAYSRILDQWANIGDIVAYEGD